MDGLNVLLREALAQEGLSGSGRPGPAAHHARIETGLAQDDPEALHAVLVAAGHEDIAGPLVGLQPGQGLFKGGADHLSRPGLPCEVRIFGTVLDHDRIQPGQGRHPAEGLADMARPADDQPGHPVQALKKKGPAPAEEVSISFKAAGLIFFKYFRF